MIRFCALGALLMLPGCRVVGAVLGGPTLREVGLRGLGWLDRVPNAFNDGFIRQRSLRVTFTAGRNLTRFARDYGYAIGADVRFCDGDEVDHCNRLGALGPADAETGRYPGMLQPKPEDLAGEGCLYHLFIDERTDAIRLYAGYGSPPDFRYHDHDLRREPVDVCFQLRGGTEVGYVRSNTVRIPAATIRAALANAPAE